MPSFPQVPRDFDIELLLGGSWVNITNPNYVQNRDPVTIARGRPDESPQVDPSRLTMTLNNRDGRWSPRNPLGAYYGLLGRNVSVRASVKRGAIFLEGPGEEGDEATAPDATALGIVGDIDIRIDLTTSYWTERNLCGKYRETGSQRSWALQVDGAGYLVLTWSTAGTGATAASNSSTVPIPLYPGRLAIRVTLDVNNGASGHTTTFYTSDSISGSWTQLGSPVTNPGVVSIFDSTAPVEVGDITDVVFIDPPNGLTFNAPKPIAGQIHGFQLRNGIAGTVVANPDFTAQPAGTTSFADTASPANTWTLQGGATISNRRWRFHGELASLLPRSDVSGRDVSASLEAGGMLRRLSQGNALRSAIYRGVISESAVVAYWPCEDDSGATSIASALSGGRPMTITGPSAPELATSDVFVASSSLPSVNNSTWDGPVRYTQTSQAQIRFLLALPATGGVTNNAVLVRVLLNGVAKRLDVIYQTGGQLTWALYDYDGTTLFTASGSIGDFDGTLTRVSMELKQNGANIDMTLNTTEVGTPDGFGLNGTATSLTFGRVQQVSVDPTRNVGDTVIGHISVHSAITSILDIWEETGGWAGETAGRRVERLCAEENIPFRAIGNLDDSATMGVQRPASLVTLLQECADADLGIVFEPREVLGLGYRTRTSLYNADPAVTLDYASGQLSGPLDPVDDDQTTRNDITVSRTDGSSARAEVVDGPLSVLPPPDGAGRYIDQVTINVDGDGVLPDQAAWRAHLGTVDEARYRQLAVNYASPEISGNSVLVRKILDHEVGDVIAIDNPPAWLPPDRIRQLSQGTTETYTNFEHEVTISCAPATPYDVAVYDDTVLGRLDTAGSQVNSGVNATATTLSVATTSGPLWTTSAADMPFDIGAGGERITVTAVSGSSSPQTFTVVRSVNGVSKAQLAGTAVSLWSPSVYAL